MGDENDESGNVSILTNANSGMDFAFGAENSAGAITPRGINDFSGTEAAYGLDPSRYTVVGIDENGDPIVVERDPGVITGPGSVPGSNGAVGAGGSGTAANPGGNTAVKPTTPKTTTPGIKNPFTGDNAMGNILGLLLALKALKGGGGGGNKTKPINPNAYTFNRKPLAQPTYTPYSGSSSPVMGRKNFEDATYTVKAAEGGLMGMAMQNGPMQTPYPANPMSGGASQYGSSGVQFGGNSGMNFGLQRMDSQSAAEGGVMGLARGGSAKHPRYLQGITDGMADKLSTNIDGKQPAALSHGEFVIPADVVSHLGNGNSEAGAKQLYKMMDRIRLARTGNKKQGKRINPEKFTPGGIAGYAGGGVVAFTAGGITPEGTTTVESNLASYAAPGITDYIERGTALAKSPYQAYTGPLTAGTSRLQQQAFTNASNLQIPAAMGQASKMVGDAGNKLGALSYNAAPVSSTYSAPTGYTAGQVGNVYSGTGVYNPQSATNQFSNPAAYQAGSFNNQYSDVGPYNVEKVGNQYTGTGAYNAQAATNQFTGPAEYKAGQFGNQYTGTGAYNAQKATNQFSGPDTYKAGQFGNQYKATDPYAASDMQLDKFNTAQMQQYMNPYLQMSLEPQIAEARRQSQITQMGNAAKLAQAGAFGGSRGALMDTETQRNLLQNLAGITGQGYNTAYNTALNSFNTQQSLGLQAQQANEASRQFGANQGLSNAQNAAQYGMAALNAGEASRQFGANQAMTAAQQQAQYGQAAQAQDMQDRQFSASQALSNAQNAAQYGMAALNAGEASRQFGANQAMTAAQQRAQYGQSAQAQNAQERQFSASQALANAQNAAQFGQSAAQLNANQQQFGANQALSNAQNRAQYGLAALNAGEASRQFGANQAMTGAQAAAQYGQAAQSQNANQQQFAANQALANAQNAAQYGLAGFNANEQARQTQGSQALANAQNAAQFGQSAQALNAQQQQFGANLGLSGLQGQLNAGTALGGLGMQQGQLGLANLNTQSALGATQRGIEQEGIDALYKQYEQERLDPYKQIEFQKSLYTGLPLDSASKGYSQSDLEKIMTALGLGTAVRDTVSAPR
jgi:hypothetical protein